MAGDFNNFDDLDSFSIVSGKSCSSKASSAHSPTFWKNLTSDFIEVQGLGLSHYNAASDKLNAVSRLFWLTPGWLALSADLNPHCEDPAWLHSRGLSDHAPVGVTFAMAARPSAPLSIPPGICKHPYFKQTVDKLAAVAQLHTMGSFQQLEIMESIIRESARLTFDKEKRRT